MLQCLSDGAKPAARLWGQGAGDKHWKQALLDPPPHGKVHQINIGCVPLKQCGSAINNTFRLNTAETVLTWGKNPGFVYPSSSLKHLGAHSLVSRVADRAVTHNTTLGQQATPINSPTVTGSLQDFNFGVVSF